MPFVVSWEMPTEGEDQHPPADHAGRVETRVAECLNCSQTAFVVRQRVR
jgi:hypothetical protein